MNSNFILTSRDIIGILVKPKDIIERGFQGNSKLLVIIMMLLSGLISGIYQCVNFTTIKPEMIANGGKIGIITWQGFWMMSGVMALIYFIPKYIIGGFWFKLRTEWVIEKRKFDKDSVNKKHIYIFSHIITSVTILITYIILSLTFKNVDYSIGMLKLGMCIPLIFQFVRVYFCYKYVQHNYNCDEKLNMWMFLIIPCIWYGITSLTFVNYLPLKF